MGSNVFDSVTSLKVYCEADSKPDGWDANWDVYATMSGNYYRCQVTWGVSLA